MADVKFNDFLLQYFMQLHFNKMDPEVFAQFQKHVKNNDLTKNMKEWNARFMENGKKKKLPNPDGAEFHLTDAELKKMFKEFQNAFRSLDANRKNFSNTIDFGINNDAIIGFVNQYFGTGRLFTPATISDEAKQEIAVLLQLLEDKRAELSRFFGMNNNEYEDLITSIKDKKYLSDIDFQSELIRKADAIQVYSAPGNDLAKLGIQNFTNIVNNFEKTDIDDKTLTDFKKALPSLLDTLANNSKIRDAFPSNKVKSAFDKSKSLVGYDDTNSKDYIAPKVDDKLTPVQRISEWAGKTYSDVFEKYIKFTGDRLYFSPEAKTIVGALNKKVKPTDGLEKIVSSAKDIKNGISNKSKAAAEHFDWLIEQLEKIKSTTPKAFEGALSNGRQMRTVVEQLIMNAVKDGKDADAKVKSAMEVLSVVRYGYTTSKIMDTMSAQEFSIFSDKDLSWNKNEGMQFVTNALDKSIKFAFMTIGYGITAAVNAYNLRGIKFRGRLDQMSADRKELLDKYQDDKKAAEKDKRLNNKIARDAINKEKNTINATGINSRRDFNAQKRIFEQNQNSIEQDETQLQTDIEANASSFDIVEQYEQLLAKQNDLNTKQTKIQTDINTLEQEIKDKERTTSAYDADARQEIDNKKAQLATKKAELTTINNELNIVNTQLTHNHGLYQTHKPIVDGLNARENDITRRKRDNDNLKINIQNWKDATEKIKELQDQIKKRDDEFNKFDETHQDKFQEYMAYWDMLETGRDFHTGKMYNWGRNLKASNAQKRLDEKKDKIFADYLEKYTVKD